MKQSLVLVLTLLGLFTPIAAKDIPLKAVGASFPYPLYSTLFDTYEKKHAVNISYDPAGSGAGIKRLRQKSVDFAASDSFLSDSLMERIFLENHVIHVPICASAVAIAYNLDGIKSIHLDSDVITGIYFGRITRWNDEKIQALNPDLDLPNQSIIPVRRSDSSGTTFIFSDFLSKTNKEWASRMGRGKNLNWPIGIAAKGNEAVAKVLKEIPGSFSYLGYAYANQKGLSIAKVKNQAGQFIYPDVDAIAMASDSDIMSVDTRVFLTNTDNPKGYPISSLTWIIAYKDQQYSDRSYYQAKATHDLIHWMLESVDEYGKPLMYAPLSPKMKRRALKQLEGMHYSGKHFR